MVGHYYYIRENFQGSKDSKESEIAAVYEKVATTLYNPFLKNWEKAIVSSIGLEANPLEPQKTPTRDEMNQYIEQLSVKLGKPLPPLTDPLPKVMDPTIPLPNDPAPYTNALTWMNTQLAKSHEKLGALQGKESFVVYEGFDATSICQQMVQCQESQKDKDAAKNQELSDRFAQFGKNADLSAAFNGNLDLMEKSKKIQDAAQSGELLNQMNLPTEDSISYSLPEGADALTKMKKNNPAKYDDYEKNYGQFFALKGLMDQINSNLR